MMFCYIHCDLFRAQCIVLMDGYFWLSQNIWNATVDSVRYGASSFAVVTSRLPI